MHSPFRLLMSCLVLACASASEVAPVASLQELSDRITFFYQKREAAQVAPMIRYVLAHQDEEETKGFLPLFMTFVYQVMRDQPDAALALGAEGDERPVKQRGWLLYALWWSGHPRAVEVLNAAAATCDDVAFADGLRRMAADKPGGDVLDAPGADTMVLDQCWISFMATGQAAYVERVIDHAVAPKAENVIDLVGTTAAWSVRANRDQHARVREILEARRDRETDEHRRAALDGLLTPAADAQGADSR
ncbi:MAG: hypothetical protein H0W72_05410 [Planctomycetes bacterium]|nr:hypothetical protein [Planctomycetota bacterium]